MDDFPLITQMVEYDLEHGRNRLVTLERKIQEAESALLELRNEAEGLRSANAERERFLARGSLITAA